MRPRKLGICSGQKVTPRSLSLLFILFIYLFIYFLSFLLFLGLPLRHMEVPRLGVESEP